MTFDDALRDVVRLAQDPGATTAALAKAASALASKAHNNLGELDEGVARLAEALPSATDDAKALLLGLVAGAFVEHSGSVAPLTAPLVDRMLELIPRAHRFWRRCTDELPPEAEDDDRDEHLEAVATRVAPEMPHEAEAFRALGRNWPPAVLVLSRSREARSRCKAVLPELSDLANLNEGGHWLHRLALVLDDEPYVAIEPATGLGIAGRMSGITVNFQLSMLLMAVFPQKKKLGLIAPKPRVSDLVAAIARGRAQQASSIHVTGTWNLYTWRGARRPQLDTSQNDAGDWIWNEGTPADIPTLEGRRVILLGPPSYKRGWTAQRDFANLEADLTVESTLSPAEVDRWLEQMRSAPD